MRYRGCAGVVLLAGLLAWAAALPTIAQTFEKRIVPVPATQRQSFERQSKVAVLVGVGRYPARSGLNSLSYAGNDADELDAELTKQGYKTVVLKDQEATKGSVEQAVADAGELVQKGSGTILFFFSGHGYADRGGNFLATWEASARDLAGTGLGIPAVQQLMLSTGAARQIMWIDACRNDPAARAAGARAFDRFQSSSGLRGLLSTRFGQASYEYPDIRHGLFTFYILKALRGEAAGTDGLVTFADLASYVEDSVSSDGFKRGHVQVPVENSIEANGDFLIARAAVVVPAPAPSPAAPVKVDVEALMRTANSLRDQKKYTEALSLYRQAASAGDARAMNNIGFMYDHGHGVPLDYVQAMSWYRKGADAGSADAMNNIGYIYDYGHGVPQDYAQAMSWYRKAADAGDEDAMNNIGFMYDLGHGVPQDYAQAMSWYRKAADAGSADAMNNIGYIYDYGHGVPQDDAQAMSWYRKAADAGSANAMNNIGYTYDHARGVPQDYAQALSWYRKAVDGGSASGMNNIGYLYDQGHGVAQNYAQAMSWYRKAADADNPTGMDNIGVLYEYGQGVKKDLTQAAFWYRKALDAGYEAAKDQLKRIGR